MEITREGRRMRWAIMFAGWTIVAALALWHTLATRDYIKALDQIRRPGAEDATPLRRIVPGNFADAEAWVRYAISAQETGRWQLRFTDIDNAPNGRELHWSSLFAHMISAAGRIEHARHGQPLPRATEDALMWFNLPLLLGTVVLFSSWAAKRGGAGAGILAAGGMIGLGAFYDGFLPNYGDHHGLLTASAFGLSFGALLMGAGWVRNTSGEPRLLPDSLYSARRAATLSALSGAVGMWISAASVIPVIALIGIAGLGATIFFGRRAIRAETTFYSSIWRQWGRSGAAASFVFYCLEYAPAHLSWRLEVNHPCHSLAWWGGAELVGLLCDWYLNSNTTRPPVSRIVLSLLAVAVVPLTIAIAGSAAFVIRDPFVGELRHTVVEGMSFRAASRLFGTHYSQQYLIYFILVAAGIWLTIVSRRDRVAIGFATSLAAAFVGFACWEIRWWLTTSAPILCVLIVGVSVLACGRTNAVRWLLVLGIISVILPGGLIHRVRAMQANILAHTADQADILQPLYRDVALAIRSTQPEGDVVLLASPDASNSIGYFGRFKSIGTLYWENVEGLKTAAAIYGAERDDDALRLIQAHQITHIVYVSKGDYIQEYFRLANPGRSLADLEKTFAQRVFIHLQIPRWLRAIPYRPPANVSFPGLRVMIWQVMPQQNENAARWHLARAQIELGNFDVAERLFRQAINLAPPGERLTLTISAADYAYPRGGAAMAVQFYRQAIAAGDNVHVAAELAWILATTRVDGLRNGRDALALIAPYVDRNPTDVVVLNTFAAALAENGRFAEAEAAAGRALKILRDAHDHNGEQIIQQRMQTYHAAQPWRQ